MHTVSFKFQNGSLTDTSITIVPPNSERTRLGSQRPSRCLRTAARISGRGGIYYQGLSASKIHEFDHLLRPQSSKELSVQDTQNRDVQEAEVKAASVSGVLVQSLLLF